MEKPLTGTVIALVAGNNSGAGDIVVVDERGGWACVHPAGEFHRLRDSFFAPPDARLSLLKQRRRLYAASRG